MGETRQGVHWTYANHDLARNPCRGDNQGCARSSFVPPEILEVGRNRKKYVPWKNIWENSGLLIETIPFLIVSWSFFNFHEVLHAFFS